MLRKLWKLCSTLGMCALALLVAVHFTPLTQVWARALAGDWADARGRTLIVLSSEIEADGVLGPSSYNRALYAVRAYRAGGFNTIIVTGGRSGAAPVSMGEALRDFLVASGVPANIVRVESRATSTRENALFVKALLQGATDKPVLLTSDFHMFRARRVFEKAGVHVAVHPIPDVLKRSNHIVNRWVSFWTLIVETGKIGYYAWKRWL